ncbi:myosin head, partial [Ostertagia ostertagi]
MKLTALKGSSSKIAVTIIREGLLTKCSPLPPPYWTSAQFYVVYVNCLLKNESSKQEQWKIEKVNQCKAERWETSLFGKEGSISVLHNLQVRFIEREAIYTYCGIVLVAINPYADCPYLYGEEVIQVYRGVGKQVRELDPHIYAVAEEAFFDLAEFKKCQSIIVSGESGAGKTVSAKFVMKYFASIAGHRDGSAGVEDRVLATNPIMEAIGNAKTIRQVSRNDNSSRFGKFIQINFDDKFTISGAEIKTYLLEKSRLVFQARQERNYHIFYQLCAARDHPLLQDFALGPSDVYWYTAQGGDSRIPGVNDREDFEETVKALDLLGFDSEKQRSVFRILKGILLLGNIEFRGEGDSSTISPMNAAEISQLCADYKIDEAQLRLWLTVREIRAAGETVRKGLQPREAVRSRDAFAKLLYAQLFSWFVRHFNDTLMEKERKISRYKSFIGVLDIY